MGNRRNACKKSQGGAEGRAPSSMNNSEFAVFEFNDEDGRVEDESLKAVAKFGAKRKKPVRTSMDKYEFLARFTRGSAEQKHFRNDVLSVGFTDGVPQDRTFGLDAALSFGSSNYEHLSSRACQISECTCGAKSSVKMSRTGYCTAENNHNNILHLDSDEDERLKSGSLGSSINMGGNEGSLEKQSSEYGAKSHDCETMVPVSPYYVKYGNVYYTGCLLTFSKEWIQLKGSAHSDRKSTLCVEWSTFDILNIEHQHCESYNAEVINIYMRSIGDNAHETNNSSLRYPDIVELEFIILDDRQWSGKLEEIKSLDLKYKAAWKTSVSECYLEESFEKVLYPAGDPDAVPLSRTDIELLKPSTFINDTIIDFYAKYLFKKTRAEEQHRFHFFNSFFFQKLASTRQASSRACGEKDAFQSVCKWTRNVDIFVKDYIFIPVNFRSHWSLIIICHPGEVANLRNINMDKSSKVPCILHMDSKRGSHGGLEDLIKSYLCLEWKERGNACEEDILVKFLNLDFFPLQLPQQENSIDCGLFLLHYAELFMELVSNGNTVKHTEFNQYWFLPAVVSLKKRDHIKKLIFGLIDDNALKDPPDASNDEYPHKLGTSKIKRVAQSIPKNSGKELCCGTNCNAADDLDIMGQHCFVPVLERGNIGKPATTECWQPCELPVPAGGASKTCSDEFVVTLCVQSGEDHPPEVAYHSERQKAGDENSSMSCDDLEACVVEDSEDENEVESIRRTRELF